MSKAVETSRRLQIKLSTPSETRKAIARIANMVLNDELDPKRANTILYACNAVLGAIRTDEQGKRLDELERMLMEREKEIEKERCW